MEEFIAYSTGFLNPEQKQQYVQGLHTASGMNNAPAMVTYQDIANKGMLNYTGGMKIPQSVAHFGQRKLFLSELRFLTSYLRKRTTDAIAPMLVIYPGAAPSRHTGYLASLFPEVTFLLVDPAVFRIQMNSQHPPIIDLNPLVPITSDGDDDWEALVSHIDLNHKIYTLNSMFTDSLARTLA